MPAVRVEGLFKVFGRDPKAVVDRLRGGASAADVRAQGATAAVIDAGFTVEPGEIFVVMGLSGSGKSTLLRMLNGLLEPSAGRVHVGDAEVTALGPAALRRLRQERISMVFQHFALLPHRSVLENAAYGLTVRGVDRRTRETAARDALAMVGLDGWANHRPHELSGGMQQRVGLARALAAGTDVLLMDEAFSALDPLIRREMQDQLIELQSRLGKTIVFITHDLNEAMRLGDRVAIMRDGRIVQVGAPAAILAQPADDHVARFLADVDRGRVLTAASVLVPARSVVECDTEPRVALDRMRAAGARTAIVVRDGELLGVVTDDSLHAAAQDAGSSLAGLMRPVPVTVRTTTPLADLFEPAARADLPIVVVDEADRPLGVVPPTAVLGALAGITPAELPAPFPEAALNLAALAEPVGAVGRSSGWLEASHG